ncbi:MAG: sugar ABC transporter substrate-binding protein [Anaerolineae bacterium]|nr:sugar ABC transporter substrate-binding protein [Anaerolineae bacterium]
MIKRIMTSVFLLVMPVLSLGTFPANAQEEITITWRTRPDSGLEAQIYMALSESIDARLDGITLVYEAGSDESTASYRETLLTQAADHSAPDIFWIRGADLATFVSAGAIANLNRLASADADFDIDVFYPQIVQELTYDPATSMSDSADTLWGLPRDVSSFALYVNQDLFEQAGLDNPTELLETDDWNWETFAESAAAISDLGNDIYGFGMNTGWASWWLWFNEAGGSYFNAARSQCALNSEEVNRALTFLSDLYETGAAAPLSTDSERLFAAGDLGMFLNGRWGTPNILAQATFSWDYAEVPAGPAGQSNWMFWGAYVASADSASDPERGAAIWRTLKELTNVESQSLLTALGATIPSRRSDDAIRAFLTAIPDKNSAAFTQALADYALAEAPLWNSSFEAYDAIANQALTRVINGDMTMADFTASICDDLDPLLKSE